MVYIGERGLDGERLERGNALLCCSPSFACCCHCLTRLEILQSAKLACWMHCCAIPCVASCCRLPANPYMSLWALRPRCCLT